MVLGGGAHTIHVPAFDGMECVYKAVTPDIATIRELPEEESHHCVKVLRLSEGAEILLADGVGTFYKAVISLAHPKHCAVVEI